MWTLLRPNCDDITEPLNPKHFANLVVQAPCSCCPWHDSKTTQLSRLLEGGPLLLICLSGVIWWVLYSPYFFSTAHIIISPNVESPQGNIVGCEMRWVELIFAHVNDNDSIWITWWVVCSPAGWLLECLSHHSLRWGGICSLSLSLGLVLGILGSRFCKGFQYWHPLS
jgi:hypothetical protein